MDKFGPFERFVLNDPAKKMLTRAKKKLRGIPNIEFTNSYCEVLDFEYQEFDKIICLNSFHYYVDQKIVLSHFHNFLKSGGELYILDWNRKGYFLISSFLIDLLSPENINSRSIKEMIPMLNENGFTVQEQEEWSFRWWKFFFVKCIKV